MNGNPTHELFVAIRGGNLDVVEILFGDRHMNLPIWSLSRRRQVLLAQS
jgi:hypothetical protein